MNYPAEVSLEKYMKILNGWNFHEIMSCSMRSFFMNIPNLVKI